MNESKLYAMTSQANHKDVIKIQIDPVHNEYRHLCTEKL